MAAYRRRSASRMSASSRCRQMGKGWPLSKAGDGITSSCFAWISPNGSKMTYHDVDLRALLDQLAFTPDGEAIVYLVLEKGVGNVAMQSLDGRVLCQMAHDTTDQIWLSLLKQQRQPEARARAPPPKTEVVVA